MPLWWAATWPQTTSQTQGHSPRLSDLSGSVLHPMGMFRECHLSLQSGNSPRPCFMWPFKTKPVCSSETTAPRQGKMLNVQLLSDCGINLRYKEVFWNTMKHQWKQSQERLKVQEEKGKEEKQLGDALSFAVSEYQEESKINKTNEERPTRGLRPDLHPIPCSTTDFLGQLADIIWPHLSYYCKSKSRTTTHSTAKEALSYSSDKPTRFRNFLRTIRKVMDLLKQHKSSNKAQRHRSLKGSRSKCEAPAINMAAVLQAFLRLLYSQNSNLIHFYGSSPFHLPFSFVSSRCFSWQLPMRIGSTRKCSKRKLWKGRRLFSAILTKLNARAHKHHSP